MKKNAGRIVSAVLLVITAAWVATVRWVLATWAHLTLEQLVYQLKAPMEGTSTDIVLQGVVQIGLPLLAALIAAVVLLRKVSNKKVYAVLACTAVLADIAAGAVVWDRLDVGVYILSQQKESTFIEDNYVDPADVALQFPEKKRNLIYIYLESMEATYADKENGGAFEQNIIPELTRLAEENESFAGDSGILNGGHMMSGTTWTMGAIFAQSSGLPLKVSIDGNSMNTQDSFFPGITTLGDILADAGYKQVFLLGSDAGFGGRKLYFESHGNYEIQDYVYAQTHGLIPSGYFVWWGYEDSRLFENAKEELTQLAASDEPFNLTLLTVDTHFEDGYVCDLCDEEAAEKDQYGAVLSCSSRQVEAFVRWVQQQDFYENTTIVLAGDHLTMDSDFCNDVSEEYDRKTYTTYINAAAAPEKNEVREYTTFDNFPTTLAALGVKIEGDRLGLGTNLFSTQRTLLEQIGKEQLDSELSRKSEFLEQLAEIDKDKYDEGIHDWQTDVSLRADSTHSGVVTIFGAEDNAKAVTVELSDENGENVQEIETAQQADRSWKAELDFSAYDRSYGKLQVWQTAKNGQKACIYKYTGNLLLVSGADFGQYLENLQYLKGNGYAFFMAIKDEGTYSLTQKMQDDLFALGFRANLRGEFRTSYLGLYDGKEILEQAGHAFLTKSGTLPDGQTYEVCSGSLESGNVAQIILGQKEYAPNTRGINAVVYDYIAGRVVGRTVYDTNMIPNAAAAFEKTGKQTYEVTVSGIRMEGEPESIEISLWDAEHLKKPITVSLVAQEDGTYTGTLNSKKMDMTSCYVKVLAKKTDDSEIVLTQLHGNADEAEGLSNE